MDYVLEHMKQYKIPETRENYLDLAYLGNPPEPLSAEQEAELPEQFQQFKQPESEAVEAGAEALAGE